MFLDYCGTFTKMRIIVVILTRLLTILILPIYIIFDQYQKSLYDVIIIHIIGSYNTVFLHIRNLYKTFLRSYYFTFFFDRIVIFL